MGAGLAPSSYVASQGTCLGRAGRVHVRRDEQNQVWVGGFGDLRRGLRQALKSGHPRDFLPS